jgi:hypothetical protein
MAEGSKKATSSSSAASGNNNFAPAQSYNAAADSGNKDVIVLGIVAFSVVTLIFIAANAKKGMH